MWLNLDMNGIEMNLRIVGYHKPTEEWHGEWCEVDLFLRSGEWLNYRIKGNEIFLTFEVEQLCQAIEGLLTDQITKNCTERFAEPDLTFYLYPKHDIRTDPDVISVAPGHEIADIKMDLSVTFWHRSNGLTDNRLLIAFNRPYIEVFWHYLRLITNEISLDDDVVQQLIKRRILCESIG